MNRIGRAGVNVSPNSIPRYAEPTWDELREDEEDPGCRDCAYYKEVQVRQNGLTEYVGTCVYEAFQADTFDALKDAEIASADPTDEPCRDFKEAV